LDRHPHSLLTSEQLTAFVGYEIKRVAKAVETFMDGGLLERTKNPLHAARLYVLVLPGRKGEGLRKLLTLTSTRQGRLIALDALMIAQPANKAVIGVKCSPLRLVERQPQEGRYV
jgi:hypothetical protein